MTEVNAFRLLLAAATRTVQARRDDGSGENIRHCRDQPQARTISSHLHRHEGVLKAKLDRLRGCTAIASRNT